MNDLIALSRPWVVSPSYMDMTVRQLALIGILADEDGAHQVKTLALDMKVSKPVITRSVGKLAALGLVTNVPDAKDRRVRIVELTSAGKAFRQSFIDMGQA